ncbi:MAG: hypothetical protein JXJ04_25870 [Spirochaetales bacterium]|nr:hypothetical protein [Spirochaetales bacterium]
MRGGSWYDIFVNCRCAFRYGDLPRARDGSLGFRCART